MTKSLSMALMIFLGLLAGCAGTGQSLGNLPAREYTGHLRATADGNWFQPCGSAEAMWVTFTDKSVKQADEARAAGGIAVGGETFVRLRAAETLGGEVGPKGPGKPALLVRDILDLRPAAPGDCPETRAE